MDRNQLRKKLIEKGWDPRSRSNAKKQFTDYLRGPKLEVERAYHPSGTARWGTKTSTTARNAKRRQEEKR